MSTDKSPRLDFEQRQRAAALEEEIAANPYDYAHEIISLRDRVQAQAQALERIASMRDSAGNLIEMHRDELRGIARATLVPA